LLEGDFIALGSVTFPTQCLKIFINRASALCDWYDVVDFKEKIWLYVSGISTDATSEVVPELDCVT
jgi:hypothetical protein